jgi:hypothetical protein
MRVPSVELPEIHVDRPESGDSLHRVALRTAMQLLADAGMGQRPPVVLLAWALGVWACVDRVPEA